MKMGEKNENIQKTKVEIQTIFSEKRRRTEIKKQIETEADLSEIWRSWFFRSFFEKK